MTIAVPLTIDAIDRCEAWSKRPVWPRPLSDTRSMMLAMMTGLDESGRSIEAPLGDIVALAALRISSAAGAYAEAAMLCEAARSMGMRLESRLPAHSFLLGSSDEIPWKAPAPSPAGRDTSSWLRRMARTLTLNSALEGPAALLGPRHTAVTHNHLLADVARRSGARIGFRHAQSFLDEASKTSQAIPRTEVVAGSLTDALCRSVPIAGALADRFRRVAATIVSGCLEQAAGDLTRIRAASKLPGSIWSGTGAHYPTRAVALAVRSRGGEVTAFDHGGCSGIFDWEALRFGEFRTATRFVTATPRQARLIEHSASMRSLAPAARPEIVAHDGDPTFAAAARLCPAPRRARPRVMYVLGPYYGFRQWYPPLYPDPLYHHLLLSATRLLASLPIELVCRPRPAAGRKHPVESIAACDYRPFHAALADADVLVFDDVHSTAFWEALCTDRPVVVIDLGYNRFVAAVDPIVRKRARFVPAGEDLDCVPVINGQALSDAVLSATGPADPTPVIELLAKASVPSEAVQRLNVARQLAASAT